MMYAGGIVDTLVDGDASSSDERIQMLTAIFFGLYLLMATQDIAVDGWASGRSRAARLGRPRAARVRRGGAVYFAAPAFARTKRPTPDHQPKPTQTLDHHPLSHCPCLSTPLPACPPTPNMPPQALSMLSKPNVEYGSTCNSIGQNLGYFISFVGFLTFNNVDVCNSIRGFTGASHGSKASYQNGPFFSFCELCRTRAPCGPLSVGVAKRTASSNQPPPVTRDP